MVIKFSIWLMTVACGLIALVLYAGQTGSQGEFKSEWPAQSSLTHSGRPEFLMFLHPECPCSKASLGELEALMPKLKLKVLVKILFSQIESSGHLASESELWQMAELIPGVELVVDEEEKEFKLFGAETSGQAYLYDENGTLVFSGGITPARGHRGDSTGKMAVQSWLKGRLPASVHTSPFGCKLKKIVSQLTRNKEE